MRPFPLVCLLGGAAAAAAPAAQPSFLRAHTHTYPHTRGAPTDSCDAFEIAAGQDCVGNDLSNAPAVDTAACCALCSGDPACLAFCPQAEDMNLEHGSVQFTDGGWSMTGDCRVSSKASWNLLGGSIEWDMDTTQVAHEVNTNLYTSSPSQPNCGQDCYCDIQKSPVGKPSCMELDLIEANGNCAMATTLHTFATDGKPNNPDCDRWGCSSTAALPTGQFHMKAEVGTDGTTTVYMNGVANDQYNIQPSAASNAVVVKTMQSIGAVIESSQWFGWAPAESQCPTGDKSGLPGSQVAIKNVKVLGTVVQGPTPTKCS